jgi:hypothetical protein
MKNQTKNSGTNKQPTNILNPISFIYPDKQLRAYGRLSYSYLQLSAPDI